MALGRRDPEEETAQQAREAGLQLNQSSARAPQPFAHDPSAEAFQDKVDRSLGKGGHADESAGSADLSQAEGDAAQGGATGGSVAKQERSGSSFYRPDNSEAMADNQKRRERRKGRRQGRKLTWLLVGGLTAGTGGLFLLGGLGGLAIVNIKEVLMDKMGSSVETFMDKRGMRVFRNRMTGDKTADKNLSAVCKIRVKCKFKGMSDRQIARFEKRTGLKVRTTGEKTVLRKNVVTGLEKADGSVVSANDFSREFNRDRGFRSSIRKMGWKARFSNMAGKAAKSVWRKVGVSRGKGVGSARNAQEAEDTMERARKGQGTNIDSGTPVKDGEGRWRGRDGGHIDSDGNYVDSDGKVVGKAQSGDFVDGNGKAIPGLDSVTEADRVQKANMNFKERFRGGQTKFQGQIGSALSKASRVVGAINVAGYADMACTVKHTFEAVAFISKMLGMQQLIQFSWTFMNTADAIKAGEATPEGIQYMGEQTIRAAQDPGVTGLVDSVYDTSEASSGAQQTIAEAENVSIDMQDTVNTKGTFYSSTAWRWVEDGTPPDPNEVAEFSNGGPNMPDILNVINGVTEKGCSVVQNPITRIAGMLVGAAAIIASGGTGGLAAGAQAGAILAGFWAMDNLLKPWMANMITGDRIPGDASGQQTGTAVVSGFGAMQSQAGAAVGGQFATVDEANRYLADSVQPYLAQKAVDERAEASPFDATNPYTFTGSMINDLSPVILSSSIADRFGKIASLALNPLGRLMSPNASADVAFYSNTMDMCQDSQYNEMNLATDPFCNPIIIANPNVLEADTDEVVNYMCYGPGYEITDREDDCDSEYIDNVGNPLGDYKKFVNECVDSTGPIAPSTISDEAQTMASIGDSDLRPPECMSKNGKYPWQFWAFTIDSNLNDDLECLLGNDASGCEGGETDFDASSDESTGSRENISSEAKDGWVWPVPGVRKMGSLPYGATGSKGVHKGIDIGPRLGAKVVAAHDGVVNWVDASPSTCGAYVSITATGTGYYAAYQHLNGSSITVKKGDRVKAGDVIAKIGLSGGKTCGSAGFYHLHFSIESKPGIVSAYADPFPNGTKDPCEFLKCPTGP